MSTLQTGDLLQKRGEDLYDTSGDKLGSIQEIYLDADTGAPEWALVNTGMFGTKSSFVPLRSYGTGTIVGGFGGPLLFGALIQSGDPGQIFIGYVVGAAVMIIGGIIQALMGVEAARRDLEDIAPPLSATEEELDEPGEEADAYTVGRDEGRGTD